MNNCNISWRIKKINSNGVVVKIMSFMQKIRPLFLSSFIVKYRNSIVLKVKKVNFIGKIIKVL